MQLNALNTRALYFDRELQRIGHLSKVMVLACDQMRADCDLLLAPLQDPRLLSRALGGIHLDSKYFFYEI